MKGSKANAVAITKPPSVARGNINADLDTSDEIATTVFRVIVECHSWSGRLLNLMRTVNIAKKDTKDTKSARLSKIHQDSARESRGCSDTGAVKFGGV